MPPRRPGLFGGPASAPWSRYATPPSPPSTPPPTPPPVPPVPPVPPIPPVPPPDPIPASLAIEATGIEPVAIFFSAVDALTIAGSVPVLPVVGADYSTWDCAWDFGDPASGTWSSNGRSKNRSIGYTACHVYETPGTYLVALTVIAPDGTESLYTQEIVVSAFSGTTYYVAAGGDDSANGLTPATAWATVAKVIANQGTDRKFLFNRGDTFQTPGGHSLTAAGRVIFGAYGLGDKPVIESTGDADAVFTFVDDDYVFMDIDLMGPGTGGNMNGFHFNVFNSVSKILWLRIEIHDFKNGIVWDSLSATPQQLNAIVDCEIFNCNTNGMFVGGRYLSVLGCHVHDMVTSHLVRVWQGNRCVIGDNLLERPGSNRHCIKLHGPADGSGNLPTEFVAIQGNMLIGVEWTVILGPQNIGVDELVSQVICEANFCTPTSGVQSDFRVECPLVTIRNNVAVATGAHSSYQFVSLGTAGASAPAVGVGVFNNTVYRADAGGEFFVVRIQEGVGISDVDVRNNLASGPLAVTKAVVSGTCPNLTNSDNLLTDTPGFVDAAGGDFNLQPSSPAVGAGEVLAQVRHDYEGAERQLEVATDLGAYKAA